MKLQQLKLKTGSKLGGGVLGRMLTIEEWKEKLLQNSNKAVESDAEDKHEIKKLKETNAKLERKVGQLMLECDFFAEACEDAGLKVR